MLEEKVGEIIFIMLLISPLIWAILINFLIGANCGAINEVHLAMCDNKEALFTYLLILTFIFLGMMTMGVVNLKNE